MHSQLLDNITGCHLILTDKFITGKKLPTILYHWPHMYAVERSLHGHFFSMAMVKEEERWALDIEIDHEYNENILS